MLPFVLFFFLQHGKSELPIAFYVVIILYYVYRRSKVTWPPSQLMELYSSSTQELASSFSRSFTHLSGLDRNVWVSWPSGRQLRKWLPSSDLSPLKSSLNRLLWPER